jgi:nitric oxide synthase oxygenase domain/subunit
VFPPAIRGEPQVRIWKLVLEVLLVHPEYEWVGELGLQWYTIPIVSDMRLEIGGIQYPAAPFNGWYIGTQIGSRDLGDEDRYDLLPTVWDRIRRPADRCGKTGVWRSSAGLCCTPSSATASGSSIITLPPSSSRGSRMRRTRPGEP